MYNAEIGNRIYTILPAMAESPLAILVADDEENHADAIAVSLEKLRAAYQIAHSQRAAA